jgi:hypothetical protein
VSSLLLPFTQRLLVDAWPPLQSITEVSDGENSPLHGSPAYMVQLPETPPEDNNDADFTLFSQGSALGSNLMPMGIS